MAAGVYFVNGGSFTVGGGATVTGTNVTIVLTGTSGNYATANMANGATVTLSAPPSGAMTAGIVFFGDRNAPASNQNNFAGGATLNITGAFYFPSQQVIFSNGVVSNSSVCTQLIAGTIQFQGGATFSNNCTGTGARAIGGATTLVQ
jgi:hypothetical protein